MQENIESLIRTEFNQVGERWAGTEWNRGWVRSREYLGWLPVLSNARILDLGCGPATYTRSLARHAGLLVGIDLSDSMLAVARKRCTATRTAFVQGTASRLPFRSSSFDVCFCAFCFAQFFSPRRMI